jgi:hypothetical protein
VALTDSSSSSISARREANRGRRGAAAVGNAAAYAITRAPDEDNLNIFN